MDQSGKVESTSSQFDLKEIFYLLWHWSWLLVVASLIAGAGALVVSLRTTPVYETKARLLVSDPPAMRTIDYGSMVNMQVMSKTYSEMLVERPVLEGVISQLGLKISPEGLKNNITVLPISGTQLIEIKARSTNPALAADIANALGAVFADRIRELQSQRFASSQEGLSKQIAEMEEQIKQTTTQLNSTADTAQKTQLEARLTEYKRLYSNLVTNYEQVRLADVQTSTNVVISQPAIVPTKPISPKVLNNTLLGILAGAMLAILTIVIWEIMDDTLKNPDEIRKKFNLTILGIIITHKNVSDKPTSINQPRSPVAEAFRALRTNITFAGVDAPIRKVLITSATPQDGKTTVTTNLAVTFAQGEQKTILIDADLRRPQVHRRFNLANRFGLSQMFLSDLSKLENYIQTDVAPGLDVITSGPLPPNPYELLTSKKMGQIIDHFSSSNTMIVIDTPPVLNVSDAASLASIVDGVIVVVRPGKTRQREFQQTLEQLNKVNARVIGIILNGVDVDNKKYGHYYGSYHYSNYYDQGTEEPSKQSIIAKFFRIGRKN